MKRKILVVDDNPLFLKQVTRILEQAGHHVAAADDGLSALNLLISFVPDILFVDLVMPKIGGDKLCRLVRKIPHMKGCRIVIVSAAAAEVDFDFKTIGADGCIAKGPQDEMKRHILETLHDLEAPGGRIKHGEVKGVESIFARRITRELISRSLHLENILESLPVGVLEVYSGRVIFSNPMASLLLTVPVEEMLGFRLSEFLTVGSGIRLERLLQSGDDIPAEIGGEDPLEINGRFLTVQKLDLKESPEHSILLLTDVTAQKDAERPIMEAHKALEEKIRERTLELTVVNEQLRQEINERKQAEKDRDLIQKRLQRAQKR